MIDFDRLLNAPAMDVFGQPATYAQPTVPAFTLRGVFDRRHVEQDFSGTGVPVSAVLSGFRARLADFPSGVRPQQDDLLTLEDATWRVTEVQIDAIGAVLLILGGRAAT